MRILLVEDDEILAKYLTSILVRQNYVVDTARDGEAGWALIASQPYDLVLLDIGLPKLDGISLCRRLREHHKSVRVMMLTARDTVTDKTLGLDIGADDYVIKPFDIKELSARIRALLRRQQTATPTILTCGRLQMDPSTREVTYDGEAIAFSRKEYLLLELFLRHPQQVFDRSTIVDQIWATGEDPPNEETVKSHIKTLRRKLSAAGAAEFIETLYGQGYRINPMYLAEPRANEAAPPLEQLDDWKLLAVSPDPDLLRRISEMLTPHNATIIGLTDPTQVWQILASIQPDLLILDAEVSASETLNLCTTIRQHPDWNWLPIVFLTPQTEPISVMHLFQIGADDYVNKPIASEELPIRILNRLRRSQILKTHGRSTES